MEIKGAGTTIVLVSHSTAQVERICDRSIWIQDGLIQCEGNPIDVHREYLNYMSVQRNAGGEDKEQADDEQEDVSDRAEVVGVQSVHLLDKDKGKRKVFRVGETVAIDIDLNAKKLIENYYIEINLVRADGVFCYGCSSAVDQVPCEPWQGKKHFELIFGQMNLLAGKYHFDLHIANADGSTIYFGGNIAEFEVDAPELERGIVYLEHQWLKG